ncbi:hypothetical protein HDU97_005903 [Phlyctochytrium planicorne]|nr:hypothetical protein HDU97_005903 [Phlyctochytrium planicorne]
MHADGFSAVNMDFIDDPYENSCSQSGWTQEPVGQGANGATQYCYSWMDNKLMTMFTPRDAVISRREGDLAESDKGPIVICGNCSGISPSDTGFCKICGVEEFKKPVGLDVQTDVESGSACLNGDDCAYCGEVLLGGSFACTSCGRGNEARGGDEKGLEDVEGGSLASSPGTFCAYCFGALAGEGLLCRQCGKVNARHGDGRCAQSCRAGEASSPCLPGATCRYCCGHLTADGSGCRKCRWGDASAINVRKAQGFKALEASSATLPGVTCAYCHDVLPADGLCPRCVYGESTPVDAGHKLEFESSLACVPDTTCGNSSSVDGGHPQRAVEASCASLPGAPCGYCYGTLPVEGFCQRRGDGTLTVVDAGKAQDSQPVGASTEDLPQVTCYYCYRLLPADGLCQQCLYGSSTSVEDGTAQVSQVLEGGQRLCGGSSFVDAGSVQVPPAVEGAYPSLPGGTCIYCHASFSGDGLVCQQCAFWNTSPTEPGVHAQDYHTDEVYILPRITCSSCSRSSPGDSSFCKYCGVVIQKADGVLGIETTESSMTTLSSGVWRAEMSLQEMSKSVPVVEVTPVAERQVEVPLIEKAGCKKVEILKRVLGRSDVDGERLKDLGCGDDELLWNILSRIVDDAEFGRKVVQMVELVKVEAPTEKLSEQAPQESSWCPLLQTAGHEQAPVSTSGDSSFENPFKTESTPRDPPAPGYSPAQLTHTSAIAAFVSSQSSCAPPKSFCGSRQAAYDTQVSSASSQTTTSSSSQATYTQSQTSYSSSPATSSSLLMYCPSSQASFTPMQSSYADYILGDGNSGTAMERGISSQQPVVTLSAQAALVHYEEDLTFSNASFRAKKVQMISVDESSELNVEDADGKNTDNAASAFYFGSASSLLKSIPNMFLWKSKAIKADLGDKLTLVYDPQLKKYVSPVARNGTTPQVSSTPMPPPPPASTGFKHAPVLARSATQRADSETTLQAWHPCADLTPPIVTRSSTATAFKQPLTRQQSSLQASQQSVGANGYQYSQQQAIPNKQTFASSNARRRGKSRYVDAFKTGDGTSYQMPSVSSFLPPPPNNFGGF